MNKFLSCPLRFVFIFYYLLFHHECFKMNKLCPVPSVLVFIFIICFNINESKLCPVLSLQCLYLFLLFVVSIWWLQNKLCSVLSLQFCIHFYYWLFQHERFNMNQLYPAITAVLCLDIFYSGLFWLTLACCNTECCKWALSCSYSICSMTGILARITGCCIKDD
jgi:hypothetical protein